MARTACEHWPSLILALAIALASGSWRYALAGETITSIRDGAWSSAATWKGSVLPRPGDAVAISHAVVCDPGFPA